MNYVKRLQSKFNPTNAVVQANTQKSSIVGKVDIAIMELTQKEPPIKVCNAICLLHSKHLFSPRTTHATAGDIIELIKETVKQVYFTLSLL